MAIGDVDVGQELLNVPMGDMIRSMALAIAEGQWELDKASMTVTELMSGQRLLRDIDSGRLLSAKGELLPESDDTEPTVIDSRVFFGYRYEGRWNLSYGPETEGKFQLLNNGQPVTPTEVGEINKVKPANAQAAQSGPVVSADKMTDATITALNATEQRRVPQKLSMMELGFVPTFYQFVDVLIEVRISVSIHGSTENTRTDTQGSEQSSSSAAQSYQNNGYWWRYNRRVGASQTRNQTVRTSQVNAAYSSKYSYDVTGSSTLRTKLVPVPPPAVLEERVRAQIEIEREHQARVAAASDANT